MVAQCLQKTKCYTRPCKIWCVFLEIIKEVLQQTCPVRNCLLVEVMAFDLHLKEGP